VVYLVSRFAPARWEGAILRGESSSQNSESAIFVVDHKRASEASPANPARSWVQPDAESLESARSVGVLIVVNCLCPKYAQPFLTDPYRPVLNPVRTHPRYEDKPFSTLKVEPFTVGTALGLSELKIRRASALGGSTPPPGTNPQSREGRGFRTHWQLHK
jgi:hypothetical protein